MAVASVVSREERVAAMLATVMLAGSFLLFLLQLPDVVQRTGHFSPWIYLPGVLAFFLALWKRADAIVQLAVLWLGVFFMIDVVYGISLFR